MHSHSEIMLSFSQHNQGPNPIITEATGYWKTWPGIQQRLDMIGEEFTFRVMNGTISALAGNNGADGLEWEADRGEATPPCNYCDGQDKRRYRIGQFLPKMPAHMGCVKPDTLVTTRHDYMPIQEVKLGDLVVTHRGRLRPVTQLHRNWWNGELFNIAENWLTGNHPVFTPKGWVRTDNLKDATQVLALSARALIHSDILPHLVPLLSQYPSTATTIRNDKYEGFVHNLTVEDDASYLIGKEKIVVHNCRCEWRIIYSWTASLPGWGPEPF